MDDDGDDHDDADVSVSLSKQNEFRENTRNGGEVKIFPSLLLFAVILSHSCFCTKEGIVLLFKKKNALPERKCIPPASENETVCVFECVIEKQDERSETHCRRFHRFPLF